MKNHVKVNNKLIQTNKRWDDLKEKQKEFIYNLFKNQYKDFYETNNRLPNKEEKEYILNNIYSIIEEKEIWIPVSEVKRFYQSKINKLNKLVTEKENVN